MTRLVAAAAATLLLALTAPLDAQPGGPSPSPAGPALVVEGRGTAHGMGLAMDGVLGQARAGWSYGKILDTFYVGSRPGSASGTLRVGLSDGATQAVVLPSGGTVTDAAHGGSPGPGFPVHLPAGARVVVSHADGRYRVTAPGTVGAAQTDIVEVPTPAPSPDPSASPDPVVGPGPEPTPASDGGGLTSSRPIWVHPDGDPAVTKVEATGRRYRGAIRFRWADETGSLWTINHVDLETYVQGIAEEKGQGWPVEGLKVLAVAARTLAAATMDWYEKHHPKGFDICPTAMCQVYLGLDGEEPAMRQATRETAGEIRTWQGRPLLAMYHGNGGGQTDTYRLIYGDGRTDRHPYLRSVSYPHANPKTWTRAFALPQAEAALRGVGVAVPGRLTGLTVLERGDSPRVRRVRVEGTDGEVVTTGLRVMGALDLPSAWFAPRTTEDVPMLEPPTFTRVEAGGSFTPSRSRTAPRVAAAPVSDQGTGHARRAALAALAAAAAAVAARRVRVDAR